MTTERIDKLPKWAQERIRVLEMRLAEAQAVNKAVETGDTNVFKREGISEFAPLEPNAEIQFHLADKGKISAGLDSGGGHQELRIAALNGRLIIRPEAANVVRAFVQRY